MSASGSYDPMSNRAGIIRPKTSDAAVVHATLCIASACMAWREENAADTLRVGPFRLGYCGLAGPAGHQMGAK